MTAPTCLRGQVDARRDLPRDVHEVGVPVDAFFGHRRDYAPSCQRRAWTGRGPARAAMSKSPGDPTAAASSSPEWAPSRPIGAHARVFWKNLLDGACGIRPLSLFDPSAYRTQTAAEVAGDPGRLPDARRAAPHVPRRPDGRRRGARGDRRRPASTSPARTRRASGVILGGGTSGLIDSEAFFERHLRGRKARPSQGPEPPARLDHRPHRAALRPRGHQVHDHDRLLLLGQRDGLRLRRDRGGPGRRRASRAARTCSRG